MYPGKAAGDDQEVIEYVLATEEAGLRPLRQGTGDAIVRDRHVASVVKMEPRVWSRSNAARYAKRIVLTGGRASRPV